MSEEEKKTIDFLKIFSKTEIDYCKLEKAGVLDILNIIDKQQKEIEELRKEIKMVEIYKSHGIPEEVEMVIMRKDNFLRNNNNEFISKDTIKEIIEKHYPDVAITKLQELLEE